MMTLFYRGIAGARGKNPVGIVIHNDAGSQYANAAFYRSWLATHQAENGFAHYYVASDGTYQAESESNMAWHTGNANGNANYIGIEACQSMGNQATFLENEQKSFKLAAEILKRYGLSANANTVKLHRELSATSCPHRSWELHGQSVETVRAYFISQINKYLSGNTNFGNSNSSSNANNNSNTNVGSKYTVETWNKRQVVDVNGLNVRAAQNTSAKVIKTLNKGQIFNATRITRNGEAVTANGTTYKTWFEVDGAGWVSGAYVTPTNETSSNSTTSTAGTQRVAKSGTFTFDRRLPVSSDTNPNSPEVAYYVAGQSVNYDSYIVANGYVWISYISSSGTRRYIAIGPNDGNSANTWGTGF